MARLLVSEVNCTIDHFSQCQWGRKGRKGRKQIQRKQRIKKREAIDIKMWNKKNIPY